MLKDPITILVHTTVGGPNGYKLIPNEVYEFEDSPYVRLLIKSGTVSLIDPPSLEPDYLEKAGYELREGYSYHEQEEPEIPVEEKGATKQSKKIVKVPKENSNEISYEDGNAELPI